MRKTEALDGESGERISASNWVSKRRFCKASKYQEGEFNRYMCYSTNAPSLDTGCKYVRYRTEPKLIYVYKYFESDNSRKDRIMSKTGIAVYVLQQAGRVLGARV
jgi:hypothetical protein